ncbi:MAG: class aminotransferase, partial [Spirosoma sp.]|nr:class aminotransferase [Spirosoma sp.]
QEISLLSVGLAKAIQYANQVGIEAIAQQNQRLMQRLRRGMEQLDGLTLLDRGSQQSSILTFHTEQQSLSVLETALRRGRVVFTVQYPYFALIDFRQKGVDWVIRLAPHYFNTLAEMDEVVDLIVCF